MGLTSESTEVVAKLVAKIFFTNLASYSTHLDGFSAVKNLGCCCSTDVCGAYVVVVSFALLNVVPLIAW